VMVLENMVDAESIDDELEDEVADECGKFGCVTRVTVSSQQDSDSYEQPADTSDDVKIFVEFSLQSGKHIHKRVTVLVLFVVTDVYAELGQLVGLEPIGLVIKPGRLR